MPRFQSGLAKVGKVWHYKFKRDGKHYHGSTGEQDRLAARIWLDAYRRKVANKIPPGTLLLSEVLAEWLKVNQHTKSFKHLYTVSLMSKHMPLGKPIGEIGEICVEQMLADYLAKGHTKTGANALLRNLDLLLNWSVRCGWLEKKGHSLRQDSRAKGKPKPVLPIHLFAGFLTHLDSHASKDAQIQVRLMLGLGLRETEALTAKWQNLHIQVHGKHTEAVYTPSETKGGEVYPIPVPAWLLGALERIRGGKTEGLICSWAKVDKDGEEVEVPHASHLTTKPIKAAGEAVKILGLTPHRMRATFAVSHAVAGTPIQEIRAMLRHKDLSTTQIYLELVNTTARRGQERVAKITGMDSGGRKVASFSGKPTETKSSP